MMKEEYDFSKGARGKFSTPMRRSSRKKDTDLSEMVDGRSDYAMSTGC